jgi:hypothetical protein
VHLEDAELPLDEQDARLDGRHGPQSQVDHPLDRKTRCDLHDQRVLTLEGWVPAGSGRSTEVGRELALQILDEQVDPQLRPGRR